jgi:PAS domain S-box-containing protein
MLQNTSIRHKQMLIIMLITSVALLLACAAFVSFETINFRNEMVRNLSSLAKIIGNNTAAALDFNDAQSAAETLLALKAQPNIIGACVFSRSGSIFAKYGRPGDTMAFTPPPEPQAAGYSFGKNSLALFEPITSKGDVIGMIYLESDMRALRSKLAEFAIITAAVFILTLLVAFLLSARLQRLISEPILDLVRTARAVAQDENYSIRVIKRSTDEIGVLIDGFNEMLARIQRRDAALQAAREELELRVVERTAELAKTNQALQVENAERRRIELQLRMQTTALDAAANAVVITDHNGTIQSVNPAFTALTGYTALEAVGQNPRILKSGKNDEAFYGNMWQTISSGQVWSGELTNRRKDGSLYTEDMTITPVRSADGAIVRYIAIKQDVSERKRAEEAVRTSQQILEGIINAIPVRVFWKDKNLVYLGCNTIFARDAGFADPKDVIGKDDYQMGWRDQAEKYRGDDRQVIESGCSKLLIEEPQTTPEGNTITLLSSKMPLRSPKGEISGVLGTYMDITERKRIEAHLVQAQRLETVGKLAGGVAHEFNSILTAILGQSELLLGDLPAGSPLVKNATEINQAAGRAAKLTRQLLAYGRKQILQPETLDLNRVIAGMEGMFHHLMGADVETQILPAPGLHAVKADAGQIEQVIMNMAINARDAMPNGGKFSLETANVSFEQESVGRSPELKPGDYVMLAITDTGAGMSEGAKARMFEPFFTTKGVGRGTGLGLSTCYGIIKQSGGHISVYSEPGRGATFKIYLPRVEPQSKISMERLAPPALPRGTETIMLVEDDPALREMAATLLRRLGYTVLAAANGIEALSLKQQRDTGHIDLLFTDVVMPHMSGKELADRVRALYPHTRILFTSAYTENAIVHQGVLDKGVALLQKPFTPSALAHKLREVLDPPGVSKTEAAPKTCGGTKITDGVNTP